MNNFFDGKALVYAEGAFNTTNGKTAHGLVRFTERYEIVGVIDSTYTGKDAGIILDGKRNNIPVFKDISSAIKILENEDKIPESLIIGLAPDGGRLPWDARMAIKQALELGWNVDSGLHDFLYKDDELMQVARKK
jgi:uncharacterized NAD-dependent epimerase/dehydratase family protein